VDGHVFIGGHTARNRFSRSQLNGIDLAVTQRHPQRFYKRCVKLVLLEMSKATAGNICRKMPSTRIRLSDKQIEAGDGSHATVEEFSALQKALAQATAPQQEAADAIRH
jgi:hypothetical protein